MSKVSITMKVRNVFTGHYDIDNSSNPVEISDYNSKSLEDNANVFCRDYPDSTVTFSASNGDFVCLMPLNQAFDEAEVENGNMTFDEYALKWYDGKWRM